MNGNPRKRTLSVMLACGMVLGTLLSTGAAAAGTTGVEPTPPVALMQGYLDGAHYLFFDQRAGGPDQVLAGANVNAMQHLLEQTNEVKGALAAFSAGLSGKKSDTVAALLAQADELLLTMQAALDQRQLLLGNAAASAGDGSLVACAAGTFNAVVPEEIGAAEDACMFKLGAFKKSFLSAMDVVAR